MTAAWLGQWQKILGAGADEVFKALTSTAPRVELLHGVHRAAPEHRARRKAFVEAALSAFPPIPFDLLPPARTPASERNSWSPDLTSGRTTASSRPRPSPPDGASEPRTSAISAAFPASTSSQLL
jgi:hypothetical protein